MRSLLVVGFTLLVVGCAQTRTFTINARPADAKIAGQADDFRARSS